MSNGMRNNILTIYESCGVATRTAYAADTASHAKFITRDIHIPANGSEVTEEAAMTQDAALVFTAMSVLVGLSAVFIKEIWGRFKTALEMVPPANRMSAIGLWRSPPSGYGHVNGGSLAIALVATGGLFLTIAVGLVTMFFAGSAVMSVGGDAELRMFSPAIKYTATICLGAFSGSLAFAAVAYLTEALMFVYGKPNWFEQDVGVGDEPL